MRNTRIIILLFLISSIAISLLPGCIREDNSGCDRSDGYVNLEIRAHWPSADSIPEGIRVVLYPASGQGYVTQNFPPQGGTLQIKAGDYYIHIFSNDSEKISRKAQQAYSTKEAYTDQIDVEFEQAPEIHTAFVSPDSFWLISLPGYNIPKQSHHLIDIYPKQQVKRYWCDVEVKGAEYLTGAKGVITGMQGSILLENTDIAPMVGAMLMTPSKTSTGILFAFQGFGVEIDAQTRSLEPHYAVFTLYSSTKSYKFKVDVTNELNAVRNGGTIYIKQNIVVEKDLKPDGGFGADANDWDTTYEELDF